MPAELPIVNPALYNLGPQLSAVFRAANRSPDAVALIVLGVSEENPEAAVVLLRGRETVLLFEQWAVRNKALDPSRSDGLVEALNSSVGPEVDREGENEIDVLYRENLALRVRVGAALKIARNAEDPASALADVADVLEGET